MDKTKRKILNLMCAKWRRSERTCSLNTAYDDCSDIPFNELLVKTKQTERQALDAIQNLASGECGFLTITYGASCPISCALTHRGRAYKHELHTERRAKVAIILSILALILSVLTAFTPFADWSKEWIANIIETLLSHTPQS